MRVTPTSRLRFRLENLLFVALFLSAVGLLAWLSTRYHLQADWTVGSRNSLSTASQELLRRLDGPVKITAYVREDSALRTGIQDLVARYQRHKPDISLAFVNPDANPERVRQLGITAPGGELLIEYQGRTEHLSSASEQSMTNALQRVARSGERWLVFLTGHGERNPTGKANFDLGDWGKELSQRGFTLQTLNLAETGVVPDNTSVLVIAGPQVNLLAGEVARIKDYLDRGGNLLWLADPGSLHGLGTLAEDLGVEFQPGMIVDPVTRLLGIESPTVVPVTSYPSHPITRDFNLLTVFPEAVGLIADPPDPWTAESLLTTSPQAWSETGELSGSVRFDDGQDIKGPLDIGVALTRPRPPPSSGEQSDSSEARDGVPTQRIVVVGDGDFLSNAFLGNQGNLDLGLNIVNWLASDDTLIAVPAKTAPDLNLVLSKTQSAIIGLGSLMVLPLLLLAVGTLTWYRRRRRR